MPNIHEGNRRELPRKNGMVCIKSKMRLHLLVRMSLGMRMRVRVCACICIVSARVSAYASAPACACARLYSPARVSARVCACVCAFVCTCVRARGVQRTGGPLSRPPAWPPRSVFWEFNYSVIQLLEVIILQIGAASTTDPPLLCFTHSLVVLRPCFYLMRASGSLKAWDLSLSIFVYGP